jgi:long-chain acyl-CoA synthetase
MKYFQGEPLRHVGDLPTMGASRYRDKLAFEYRGEERSYAELEARANQVANVLVDAGIEPGDRVALYLENSLQFPEALFGVIKAGAVAVPLNHRMDLDRLAYILGDADARALVGSAVFPSVVKDLAEHVPTTFFPGGGDGYEDYDALVDAASDAFETRDRAFDDVALQPYTSGTTGDPKGVLTTHQNLLATAQAYQSRAGTDPEQDIALLVLPLFHMYGLSTVMLTQLYGGGSIVLKTLPVPSALLQAITDHEVTQFAGIPAIFIQMLGEYESNPEAYDLSSVETLGSGAAPLADDTRRRIEQVFDCQLTEGWGMTETSPAGTTDSVYGPSKAAGCIGQPLPDVEIRLVDPHTREVRVNEHDLDPTSPATLGHLDFEDDDEVTGEIAIRGPNVFEGYYGLPEKNDEVFDDAGWFYTGDIARVDADRYLWMVDRADDMMIVGGENVYPAEVEDALFEHEHVQAAAVVAAPHEVKGEAPVAYVVLEPDAPEVTERDLREFALRHVASYAHPRKVFFVDELPRSGTQKVQRYKLEEDVETRIDGALESSEKL